jgi:hypothetical protein
MLGLVGLEFLDAGFAAEFDLLAVINLGGRLAHATEALAGTPGSDGFEHRLPWFVSVAPRGTDLPPVIAG